MTQTSPLQGDRWWQTGVIYQIYPLTFADGNGDGIGDLQGIIQRLDYLNDGNPDSTNSLGIDAIWLSPINASPMVDNGYDVSDYYTIHPPFGTLDDFDKLVREAHQRGLKIILDLVVNHSSNQHPWFVESQSSRDNPKADWYLWRDPNPNGQVPNNWQAYFGGSGWTYCTARDQYYFHSFNQCQPDLNWRHSEVKQAIFEMMRFWLDKGVDGFRMDATSVYCKDPAFRNNPARHGASDCNPYNNQHHLYTKDLPETHQLLREFRQLIDEYEDRILIGETFIDSSLYESNAYYGAHHDEVHLALTFEFPFSPWHAGHLQREIAQKEILTPTGDTPTYFLDNHDIPRHLSRWGTTTVEDSTLISYQSAAIARAAATLLLTIRGTPILYYGQELGMIDHPEISADQQRDQVVMGQAAGTAPPPRDSCRTPMQWDNSAHAGFSFGKDVPPWLPVHPNFAKVNVAQQNSDPNSILSFYRQLLRLRKHNAALREGDWHPLIHYPDEHLVYLRQTPTEIVLVVINFTEAKPFEIDLPVEPTQWLVLLSNEYPSGKSQDLPTTLAPAEVTLYQKKLGST
jgi:alpha-glucosidase